MKEKKYDLGRFTRIAEEIRSKVLDMPSRVDVQAHATERQVAVPSGSDGLEPRTNATVTYLRNPGNSFSERMEFHSPRVALAVAIERYNQLRTRVTISVATLVVVSIDDGLVQIGRPWEDHFFVPNKADPEYEEYRAYLEVRDAAILYRALHSEGGPK